MRPVHTLLLGIIILLTTLGGPITAQSQPYSVWNTGPHGLSHLVEWRDGRLHMGEAPVFVAQGDLAPRDAWAVLIVEPRRGYTDAEVDALRGFVERGGTALIAGASPATEELLLRLRVGAALGGPVYSPGYHGDARHPLAIGLGGEYALEAPRAVYGGDALLVTGVAWEDLDRDGGPDVGEPVGEATVATVAWLGRGRFVVVGSASPFTAEGWSGGAGAALTELMFSDDARGVVVDEAHRTPLDPARVGHVLAGAPLGWLLTLLALAAGGAWTALPLLTKRGSPDPTGARALVRATQEAGGTRE